MTEENDPINQLLRRLEVLTKKQEFFSIEINELRQEINLLNKSTSANLEDLKETPPVNKIVPEIEIQKLTPVQQIAQDYKNSQRAVQNTIPKPATPKIKSDIEKFIGENLISKIGIAITVIGVAIGAKYSIEHDLISPLTRIILGYLAGIGLLGFGIKLKKKYENYSAVLVSGAIAIMYFITYAAYSYYGLLPQLLAFSLMVIFTAFGVVAAIQYNKQVIAHIGLVGAYAVPFLLSDGSGKVMILFSYMAIINIGILVIAFKKYWKALNLASFALTWLIFFGWYMLQYDSPSQWGLAFTFLIIFFVTFYITFLAYKLVRKEIFGKTDVLLILVNSFIFYGIGYTLIAEQANGENFLGLFTAGNAIIHCLVSIIIYKQKLVDKNLLYLISGLVLVFITITIPVQLDGNWVTLLWTGEAALLFWIGRRKQVSIYEKLSYPLMALAFISIVQDWSVNYFHFNGENISTKITPLINIHFLTSLLFVAAFGFINQLNLNKKYPSAFELKKELTAIISVVITAVFIITLYYSFRLEIENYWDQLYADSTINIKAPGQDEPDFYNNFDLLNFKTIWIINYSLLFLSLLAFVNLKKIKNIRLGYVNVALNVFAIFSFLTLGIAALSELRETYLHQTLAEFYRRGSFNMGIRYVSFAFVALTLFACYRYLREMFPTKKFKIAFDFILHIVILWIASTELVTWMEIANSSQSYKLGLSILWGIYSLFLIILGIWKSNKPLRVGAIGLFGITLLKLFFYDIANLDTISKTIVFVSLGVLLLIISFLYNKYKHIISNDNPA